MKVLLPVLLGLIVVGSAFSQSISTADPPSSAVAAPTPAPAKPKFERWFDLDTFNLQTRYRYVKSRSNTAADISQQQWQLFLKGHFQLDPKARFRVNWLVQTGNSFTAGWNNTGWGTGIHQTNLYVKQLYFDARPTKNVEFQIGGIEFNRGEATEAITYDNDGYLTGERLIIRAPKQLFFDEISATNAYLGDLTHPNVFERFHHLAKSDYHQFLVRKAVSKEVSFSFDYTFESGKDRLHQALKIKDPKRLFFNTLLIETYQRLDPQRDAGMDVFAEKVANKRLTVNGGFSRTDRRIILNGDRFQPGKRLYVGALIKLGPVFSVNPVLIHAVGELPTASTHRTRFDLIFTYNVLEDLRRHHVF